MTTMSLSTVGPGGGVVPKSMVDALDTEDPYQALLAISHRASQRALALAQEWQLDIQVELPELLRNLPNTKDLDSHPIATATACSDSILHSLTKIASGGSQASQEIKQLEGDKRELEEHAQDVQTALILRKASDTAAQALSAQRYAEAAQAIQDYILQRDEYQHLTERAKAYAGEYTVTQLESTQRALQQTLLQEYQKAVEESNIVTLGNLTPLVQMVQLEQQAVELYLRFLKSVLVQQLQTQNDNTSDKTNANGNNNNKPPYVPMAKVYNIAVTVLRHHLPMVSHCLNRAAGDAAVVQLVHLQVEQAVIPMFQSYIQSRQLPVCSRNAQQVYVQLEDRYSAGGGGDGGTMGDDVDDCGFTSTVGTLADVDAAMEESALLLQHAETYTRFIQHTVREVNKARAIRQEQQQQERRQAKERKEWAAGLSKKSSSTSNGGDSKYQDDDDDDDDNKYLKDFRGFNDEDVYKPLEILPPQTQMQEIVAEVGGYYSVIERCLLLASMQRAFVTPIDEEPTRHLTPLGHKSNLPTVGNRAMQTSVVESCLYAARRSVQRAFATGHTGTASAMTNYCADCLRGVLAEFLARRAEEWGVTALKPGEGLLEGSAGLFNYATTQIMRQGQHSKAATITSSTKKKADNTSQKELEIQQGISLACATLNDLQVAAKHTAELESILKDQVAKGFPPNTHETEQLQMCVSSLGPVAQVMELASKNAVESLVSVLKPRIRAIVTDAVGGDQLGTGAAAFALGGTKSTDRHMVRMNYDLDEEAYQLLEVSEGYISRLCTCLDDLILPLCSHLAPSLSDEMVLDVLGTVAKRLEVSLKKCRFTALGALSLDSDMRDFFNYAKDRLDAQEYHSNVTLTKTCPPLGRLMQIAKLVNVDDLDDVLDLISASKRKGNWDLTLEDTKAYLCLRVEFESSRVHELLKSPEAHE